MKELYIISTPIGNMEDITIRAVKILKELKLLIVEDTRTAKKLLSLLEIPVKDKIFISYYKGIEGEKTDYLLNKIKEYEKAGILSEAGTPLISDPGFLLIKKAKKEGINVISVPGPVALIAALTIGGINPDNFLFLGFLPRAEQKLLRLMRQITPHPWTIVFYESPNRIGKTLKLLSKIIPERKIAIVREITKKFEETIEGKIKDIVEKISNNGLKGEITVIIEGNKEKIMKPKNKRELLKLISSMTTLSDKKIEKLFSNKYGKD
jgi:16S rRNA (cytidine1402-2'-O)-methyltransferase